MILFDNLQLPSLSFREVFIIHANDNQVDPISYSFEQSIVDTWKMNRLWPLFDFMTNMIIRLSDR